MQTSAPRIEAYQFGRVTIDGQTYTHDLIICPDGIRADWWRKEGHGLCPEDLDAVIHLDPEVLIVGCGRDDRLKVPLQRARRSVQGRRRTAPDLLRVRRLC